MVRKRYKTKQKKRNKKQTKRNSRKTMKKNKKGGEYSELAKNIIRKNASRYPKRFHATIEQTNPAELIKRKKTPKVYPRKGPGIGGKRKTRKNFSKSSQNKIKKRNTRKRNARKRNTRKRNTRKRRKNKRKR